MNTKSCSLLALGALALGCSDLAPSADTWQSKLALTDSGTQLPENWACLDQPPPAAPNTPPRPFTYDGYVMDYRTVSALAANVRGCLITDAACDTGVGNGVPVPARGQAPAGFQVQLPPQFEGFLRVTADNYVTFDYYIGGPINQDVTQTQAFSMVSLTSFAEFVRGIGADPTAVAMQGVLAAYVFDCNNDPAPNVTLHLVDAENQPALQAAEPWSIQGHIPVLNQPTDAEGISGFINLPIGNFLVEAEVLGRTFGRRSFRIDAGRETAAIFRSNYVSGL